MIKIEATKEELQAIRGMLPAAATKILDMVDMESVSIDAKITIQHLPMQMTIDATPERVHIGLELRK